MGKLTGRVVVSLVACLQWGEQFGLSLFLCRKVQVRTDEHAPYLSKDVGPH